MKKIITILQHQRIKCFKYNTSLDDPRCFYAATLRLSEDGKQLIIINKRPINARKYVGTTDPKEVGIASRRYKEALKEVQARKKRHRDEALETIFKENDLSWDENDD